MEKIGWIIMLVLVVLVSWTIGFSQENYKIHLVQQGETWAKLAVKFEIPMEELAKFNGRTTKDLLFAGEGIKIPLPEDKAAVPLGTGKPWLVQARFYLLVIVSLITVLFLIRRVILKPKQKSVRREQASPGLWIKVNFKDGKEFMVHCLRKIIEGKPKLILCPVPECHFRDKSPYEIAKHLKWHYKRGEIGKRISKVTD